MVNSAGNCQLNHSRSAPAGLTPLPPPPPTPAIQPMAEGAALYNTWSGCLAI